MRNPRCAFSAAAALRRVFILPAERPLLSQLRPQLRPSSLTKPTTTTTLLQHRSYASALPRDEQIAKQNFPFVHLVDETGKLSPPQRVADILASLDRKTQSLHTVALPPPRLRSRWEQPPEAAPSASEDGPGRTAPEIPVCKIINKVAAVKAAKAVKKKPANPSQTVKTLELNWAIDPHDLEHRLKRMREFLEKGYRVDVVLIGKRKKRKASPEEAAETLRRIRGEAEEVEGAKEWKGMEGKVGGQVTVYLEGKAKKVEE